MIPLEHSEAILFRMLASFFGKENVIPHMSVRTVCSQLALNGADEDWARRSKCLFTVVDNSDEPKLVVEFFSGFDKPFRPQDEEHQRILRPLLQRAGIAYITVSDDEFDEISDPSSHLDFFHWLKAKFEAGQVGA